MSHENCDFINLNLKVKPKALICHTSGPVKYRWF